MEREVDMRISSKIRWARVMRQLRIHFGYDVFDTDCADLICLPIVGEWKHKRRGKAS